MTSIALLLSGLAFALPLVTERFDAAGMPDGWKATIAAQNGGGAPSAWAVEGGALVLRAEARTKRFTALSRKVELRGVEWVRVVARTRAEGVTAAGACDVYVRFEGGAIQPTRPCGGAADWTEYTRYYAVPKGARDVEVGFLLTGPGIASVDHMLLEPVTPAWKTLTRGHFVYHWLGGDGFDEDQLTANDDRYDAIVAFLGTPGVRTIDYWKYADAATIGEYTGRRDGAQVEGTTIHTLWRGQVRELVRVLARAWGTPPAFLAEGLAVHLAGEWDGRNVKLVTRGLVGRGEAPTLEALLADFSKIPPERALPTTGAFVEWLTTTGGAPAVKKLYGALGADATPEANRAAMEAALGMTLTEADAAFRGWL